MQTNDFLPTLTGSFSQPAAENPTVVMMEAAYRHHKLHYRYINCEVSPDNLLQAVNGAKAMGWAGFNCSIPHKVDIIQYIDGLGISAELIGAVNTVVRKGEKWIGENTDGKGFVEALKKVIDPASKKIILLGAGGAARAVAVELALAEAADITIVNRTRERAIPVVDIINKNTSARAQYSEWSHQFAIAPDIDIVINATSIGLSPHSTDKPNINYNSLLPEMVVADFIPNPPDTRFLKTAREKGCITINGWQMLVNQGALAIEYWTGTKADTDVMHAALHAALT